MSKIIKIQTHSDTRGSLAVVEKILPFEIKRVYFIYDVESINVVRGGHRHKKTIQALICLNGSCKIDIVNKGKQKEYLLDSPSNCLILEPDDWHQMKEFTKGSVLTVMASEYFEEEDYIDDKN